MKVEKIMRTYYKNLLANHKQVELPTISMEPESQHIGKMKWRLSWDDLLGYAVTVAYLVQFIIPEKWWTVSWCVSIFRIGF